MEAKVSLSRTNSLGLKVALVHLKAGLASEMLKIGRIKVGCVSSRIREREYVQKCYKRLGYGHMANLCKGTDRSGLCFKCGNAGRKANDCTVNGEYLLYIEAGQPRDCLQHVPGTNKCAVHLSVLRRIKNTIK
ncbi:hypothetical protein QE152_g15717 [Popillia japonica]|uniref:CCHC-type domain-containing protein n=1 Tax=Popillia japonica TaxID=7064 RepID=A0AAW1L7J2_POPJA